MSAALCRPTPAFPAAFFDLLTREAYPRAVSGLQLIETPMSWVLLTGQQAYKLKRPVSLDFVDLSSARARELSCREELRLNRRFSSALYEDVVAIRRLRDHVRMGEEGETIEYAVRMRQFAPRNALDQLLSDQAIGAAELDAFGRALARVHSSLPIVASARQWGEPQNVIHILSRNLAELKATALRQHLGEDLAELGHMLVERASSVSPAMADRKRSGRVRECHGDLHARNVARWQGELVAFDCLEFDPELRWIDVVDEAAFLNIDLVARGHLREAHAFLEGWLAESGDHEACRLLDVYRAHRALARAKMSLLDASQRPLHAAYVAAARQALAPRRAQLVLLCGLCGSGKTRLAAELAPLMDATHLRSDVERGRAPGLRSEDTYAALRQRARHVLEGHRSAVVDASFMLRRHREDFVQLAHRLAVPLTLIHCTAPMEVLRTRVAERHSAALDASEAGVAVLSWQRERFESLLPDEASIIDVSTVEPTRESALRIAAQITS